MTSETASLFDIDTQHADSGLQLQRFQNIVSTVRSVRALLTIPPTGELQLFADHITIPTALAALTRSTILDQEAPGSLRFPLADGTSVSLASEHITAESIAQAKQRLQQQAQELSEYIKRQQQALERMRGKAPDAAVADKEAGIARARVQLTEVTKNQDALRGE